MDEVTFWRLVLTTWRRVTALDLHHEYGMDTGDPAFWRQPFWRLSERIQGLLDVPDSRLWHVVQQAREHPEQEAADASA